MTQPDRTSTAKDPGSLATRWLGKRLQEASAAERTVIESIAARRVLATDSAERADASRDFGDRAADAIAAFGGSWAFIGLFGLTMAGWALINTELLGTHAFDPYPYIFLNLMLSMLAALQAPLILMSQNRQGERDRIAAQHDYEVNLRAEIAIMALHEKVDALRVEQLERIAEAQHAQIALLERLLAERAPPRAN
jgi:uncharacterized membrane protein